ncbi:hypothetical protein WDU94_011293 [Cyamophila willieti]
MNEQHSINGSEKKNISKQMTDLYYAMDDMHRGVSYEDKVKESGKYQELMKMPDVIYGDYTTNKPPPPPPTTPPAPGPSKPERRDHVYASRQLKQENLDQTLRTMRRQLKVVERKVILLEQRIERQRANTMDCPKQLLSLDWHVLGYLSPKRFSEGIVKLPMKTVKLNPNENYETNPIENCDTNRMKMYVERRILTNVATSKLNDKHAEYNSRQHKGRTK